MLALASLWLASAAFAQAPFALDTTYRTVIQRQFVNTILPLEGGGVIASGVMRFPGEFSDKRLIRLLPDGSRDETFYNSGLGEGKLTDWNDGLFYVATSQSVRRILPTGYQDPSFIEMNLGPYFSSLQGGDYHVYPDGRVLMTGAHILVDTVRGFEGIYNLIWFSNTGYLDTTRIHRKGNGTVWRFEELPTGGFICHCSCSSFDGVAVDLFFRTDAACIPDTTFHTGVFWGRATAYLPLLDGRVYVAGRYRTTQLPSDTVHLTRLLPDGSLDLGFAIPQITLGSVPNTGGLGPLVVSVRPWGSGHLLVTGQFQYVNGLPRRGICVMDTSGVLTDDFDDCGVSTFTYGGITNASVHGLVADADSTHYYIWGVYTGYDDGTTNDTLQRFVSRLHVGDFTTGISIEAATSLFSIYPNPTNGRATLQVEQVPPDAQLVVRDALGREVQRQWITAHYTTLDLHGACSGVYMIELHRPGGRFASERLVVQ